MDSDADRKRMAAEEGLSKSVERARAHDEDAWARIYRELAPVLLGYLRARGAAEPEDVLGEVFVQAVRDLDRFDGDERDFRAWIFSIAHNRLIDERRKAGRRPLVPVPEETLAHAAGAGDVEAEALSRLGAEELTAMIGRLSADQQSVVLMRTLGGLTVPEVARAIGKREGAVKQLQRRGLARLRKELAIDDS